MGLTLRLMPSVRTDRAPGAWEPGPAAALAVAEPAGEGGQLWMLIAEMPVRAPWLRASQ